MLESVSTTTVVFYNLIGCFLLVESENWVFLAVGLKLWLFLLALRDGECYDWVRSSAAIGKHTVLSLG